MTDKSTSTNGEVAKPLLPSIDKILLEKSLYDAMPVGEEDTKTVEKLRKINTKMDAYCIKCKNKSIFQTKRPEPKYVPASLAIRGSSFIEPSVLAGGPFTCEMHCVRCTMVYKYYFIMTRGSLVKVGQYPSLEDIGSGDLLKYRKILDQNYYEELRRATGLYAHGIGIGSFVYLRRIFERLIENHHDQLVTADNPVSGFAKLPMDQKIGALASVLPPALVENKQVYSILSLGIHALDEVTCRRYFPVVKAAILQILDQDIAAKEAKAANNKLKAEIARIIGEVEGG